MRTFFITLFFLFCLSFPGTSFAVESKTDMLLKDETLLIVHVDLSRLNAKEIIGNNKELLLNFIEKSGLNRAEFLEEFFPDEIQRAQAREHIANPEELATLLDGGKSLFATLFDVRQVYCVLDLRIHNPAPMFFAIPKPNRHDAKSLRKAIPPREFVFVYETDDFLFVTLGAEYAERDLENFMKTNLENHSARRPDLRDAIREVEGYPIWAAFALPKYVKKIVRETRPFLPEEFENTDLVTLTTSLSWTALGIDPAKSELRCVSVAESDIAAAQFHQELEKLLMKFQAKAHRNLKSLLTEGVNEFGEKEYVDEGQRVFLDHVLSLIEPEQRKSNVATVLPEPEGNRFTIHWGSEQFSRIVGNFAPIASKFLEGAIVTAREAARRMQCTNHLKMLGIAMYNYRDIHKCFPPAYTSDAQGKPLHSWRVLLLPHLGESERKLYEKIRMDEPWDSEFNRQFHEQMPNVFRCPSLKAGSPKRDTTYCLIVGENTFGTTKAEGRNEHEITDGTSNTIMIVERKTPGCWMSPVDVTEKDALLGINQTETGIGSPHVQGVNAMMCDGSVLFFSETISAEELEGHLTIAGGEKLP